MKRIWTLLLVTVLAVFALSACGENNKSSGQATEDTGAASGAAPGDNAANDGGILGENDTDRTDETTPAGDDTVYDTDNAARSTNPVVRGTEDVLRDTGEAMEDTGSLIRGATYDEMVRNGKVHDTDGYLYDHENAVTPGTSYF